MYNLHIITYTLDDWSLLFTSDEIQHQLNSCRIFSTRVGFSLSSLLMWSTRLCCWSLLKLLMFFTRWTSSSKVGEDSTAAGALSGLGLDVGVWGGSKPWTIVKATSVLEIAIRCMILLTLENPFLNKILCPMPQIVVPVVVVRIKEIVIVKTWRGWWRAAQEGRRRESNGRCWQLVGIWGGCRGWDGRPLIWRIAWRLRRRRSLHKLYGLQRCWHPRRRRVKYNLLKFLFMILEHGSRCWIWGRTGDISMLLVI